MTDGQELSQEEVREILIAKITAAFPRILDNPQLARAIEVGSNDDLRKHLAMAQAFAVVLLDDPREHVKASPLRSNDKRERMKHVLSTTTGVMNPPHQYVLARDECAGFYTGPEWVPFNLWGLYEFQGHPLTKQAAQKLIFSPGAREIWTMIAEKYPRPDNLAVALPEVCARILFDWEGVPKVSPSEHRDSRLELKSRANQLAAEVKKFLEKLNAEDGEGLTFVRLLSEDEQDEMYERIQRQNHSMLNKTLGGVGVRRVDYSDYARTDNPDMPPSPLNRFLCSSDTGEVMDLLDSIVPALPEMLKRIAGLFEGDVDNNPLQRPKSANAARNYFVRRLIGEVQSLSRFPTIVAGITSIFFAQGITDNEVSKQMNRQPSGRPRPVNPENSA